MKLIKKIIIPVIALSSGILAGCSGFLTVNPHDSLNSDNAIESLTDCNSTTLSVYESMRASGYTSEFMLMAPDIMSDNLILNLGGRMIYSELSNFNFSSTTFGFEGMWATAYNAILSANEVITRLESNDALVAENPELANNLLAECLALRGMIHFDLVRCFGKNYQQASDSDLGVPYKKDTEITLPARNTVKEVYAWLIDDLKRANELMTEGYNSKINNRLTSKAASAILAKVYLTTGNYQGVVDYASKAITGTGSDISSLTDYTKIFTTSMAVPEVLFRIAILPSDKNTPGFNWGQGQNSSSYQANYSLTYSLNQLFKSTDVRRSTIALATQGDGKAHVCWKWFNGGATLGVVDIPMMRTPEMYLARAEAYSKLGDDAKALADLNLVRKNRYSDYVAGTETGTALFDAILLQRRLELAFEGHRFFDLKRLNQDIQRDGYGYFADGSGTIATTENVPSDSPYFLMAIPQSEINANENIIQNKY